MSSIVTVRTEHLPVLKPPYGSIQPPPPMPRPTASPAVSALKEDKDATPVLNKLDALRNRSVSTAERTVLGRVNVNVTSLQRRALNRGGITAKAIPRPAPTPDVFADESRTALGKRRVETTPIVQSKRQRPDTTDAREAKRLKEEQEKWVAKWQKAFPSLCFHFEIGSEEGIGRGLRQRAIKMGARVDQFFSHRVSHLIVKGVSTPQKAKPARRGKNAGRESDNPFLDSTGVTDLVAKAEALNVKVWTVKKLVDMLDKLAPENSATDNSLSHLLADEKLHGTRERDFNAPRPDYYYFKPGNKYLLVEDATGRNRPVMVKEYPAKDREWPVLHEHFLRLTTSSQLPASVANSHNLVKDLRARAMALYVEQVPFRGEMPPAPELKPRSQSTDNVPVTPIPEALPYLKASGNSVVITSNIASTSTANLTPGTFVGGVPQLGANKDRAIMQMSKRVQVLKGNARLAASAGAKKPGDIENRPPETTPNYATRRRSTGFDAPTAPLKEFLTQGQVISMLKQLRAPTNMTKPSYEERARNRDQVDAGYKRKEQDTASGYCENCRVRYTDLSVHIASKKHRRFAATEKNFADLDEMLECLQRPPNPLICVESKVCRPCYKPHDKHAQCGRCMDDPSLYSSPPPSSQRSSPLSSPASVRSMRAPAETEVDEESMNGEAEAEVEMDEEPEETEQWEAGDVALE